MKKLNATGMRMIAIIAAAGSFLLAAGGIASADALTGATYADASAYITSTYKGTPVIETVSGDLLDTDDCIVASWHRSAFKTAADGSKTNDYMLNLNCNAKVASPGKPGNSAASPTGRTALKDQKAAENIAKNPSFCQESDDNLSYCQRVCKRTGLCEV